MKKNRFEVGDRVVYKSLWMEDVHVVKEVKWDEIWNKHQYHIECEANGSIEYEEYLESEECVNREKQLSILLD